MVLVIAYLPLLQLNQSVEEGLSLCRVEGAHEWSRRLRELHIFTDARGDALRFGPAPYLLDAEIDEAISRALTLCDPKGDIMDIRAGTLLIASPELQDPHFKEVGDLGP